MTYVVVPDKSIGDPFTEAMWDTYIKDNQNKGLFRPIADTVLGSTATSITFNTIAADWISLYAILYGRSDAAGTGHNVQLRFNGDTGANYDTEYLVVGTTSVTGAESLAQAQALVGQVPGSGSPAGNMGSFGIWVDNYAYASGNKTFRSYCSDKQTNSSGGTINAHYSGGWRSNSAITSISFIIASGNFIVGTRATLYGVGGV